MKVKQLMQMLEDCDPEAEVLLMHQASWPFEYSVDGLCERKDLGGDDNGSEYDDDDEDDGERKYGEGMAGTDVFLVEGSQLRYGSKDAWNVVRRS